MGTLGRFDIVAEFDKVYEWMCKEVKIETKPDAENSYVVSPFDVMSYHVKQTSLSMCT